MRKNILYLALGFIIGGYIFIGTKDRDIINFDEAGKDILNNKELVGLVSSIGIRNFSVVLPKVYESDKSVVINHPKPKGKTHYVIIPKKDIKDAKDVSLDDGEYLADVFVVIGKLIEDNNLKDYKVITYGGKYQHVKYIHFHLISNN
jgi:hypothetical protein